MITLEAQLRDVGRSIRGAKITSGLGGRVQVHGQYAGPNQLSQLRQALAPSSIDHIVRNEAVRTLGDLQRNTPRKWTGETRKQWHIINPKAADYTVSNPSRVMSWLEYGTANGGTGYIYPRNSKALFIPLTRRAAMANRQFYGVVPGGIEVAGRKIRGRRAAALLRMGVDYILRKRVRGIKPRWIAAKQRSVTAARLLRAMKAHIRSAILGGGRG